MALEIPGVDEAIFNELMDGDEELYKSILSSFIDKTPSVIKKLTGVTKLTLGDYATTVHGFKAACANICADEAKKMAANLETMAKERDWAGVQAENGPFLKYIDELMTGLNDWYGKHK